LNKLIINKFNILHGFRCGAAKLEVIDGQTTMFPGREIFMADPGGIYERKKRLIPLREPISKIFNSIEI